VHASVGLGWHAVFGVLIGGLGYGGWACSGWAFYCLSLVVVVGGGYGLLGLLWGPIYSV
jgi:hypothetical protein